MAEPIPLRTLTVLLNYERCISNPNYKGRKLLTTSHIDPSLAGKIPSFMMRKPASITKTHIHVYDNEMTNTPTVLNTPLVQVSKEMEPSITSLTFAQREAIYYETRDLDGCYQAITLYQEFFSLLPSSQQISIQLKSETPLLVHTSARRIAEFTVHDPKLFSLSTVHNMPITTVTGGTNGSMHAILAFDTKDGELVVDMTRMQWGETGRGLLGEIYWLGTLDQYMGAVKDVCGAMRPWGNAWTSHVGPGKDDERLRRCAKRVLERWNARGVEGWCAYCGVGGKDLRKCTDCMEVPVWYCGKEHQTADWKLHKFTCEKRKKVEEALLKSRTEKENEKS